MSTGLTPLTAPTEARLQDIGSAEILVGIPSYNNADTVGHVVRAVSVGLAKHFPDRRAVLVNSDGGSSDETPAIVARTAIDFQHLFIGDQQSVGRCDVGHMALPFAPAPDALAVPAPIPCSARHAPCP